MEDGGAGVPPGEAAGGAEAGPGEGAGGSGQGQGGDRAQGGPHHPQHQGPRKLLRLQRILVDKSKANGQIVSGQ